MTVYPVTDAERRAYIISQYEEIELGMQHLMADTAAYHVDFVELFEKDTSYFLYHDMMAHLEIEPNWPEVSRFIAKYRALQPARSDYIKHLLK